jgi:hypothetical protein
MKINFKYRHVYELNLNPKADLMSWDLIENRKTMLESFWKTKGRIIEKTFKEVTGLSFNRKEIDCYLNSSVSFSEPLTIKIKYRDEKDIQNTLVHELVHVILMANEPVFIDNWKAMYKKFKKESPTTKVHIAVHAIHFLIAEKIFPDRLSRIVDFATDKHYVRSWDIVKKVGAQKIVDSIFKK